ncbi:Cmx/CmrA family chloramphenicol efflux MFS transporter [Actinomadura xylanilytica]|uniref:Cmx/CmrA family chloramphenicol efflux MFS transporter n=1 Tax=Actinomadura xylanilytica TaxID=887459 RepID=UPI00255AE547|nr:Cmx/CmrA family chloramphenicol efflux MFS transporter [Actinomadura xylanilytica]MDL4773020.1 MFS transporter [Actinomadura xylanilytica]
MPFAIYVLGLAVFAQGTSEFMLSGLLPDIAADLGVSIPTAGSLTSAFAVGMVIGAPLVALLSRRWPSRATLLVFLVVFLLVHVLGAVTGSFPVLLATRVVAALANAGFLAVALTAATAMVDANSKGRATSVLLGGVTIALVAGVPLGALIGGQWGWRSAFWAVAVISVPPALAILRAVPADAADPGAPGARLELRALGRPRPAVTLLLGTLVNGATFCTLTYLASVVTGVTALGESWVPAALVVFGVGAFAGVAVGGRLADGRPLHLLGIGMSALPVGWVLFAMTAGSPIAAFALVLIQGALSFAVGSTLVSQVLYSAADAPTLAGGFSTAALNIGAMVGPTLGGLAIGSGFGFRSPMLVSAALAAAALLLGGMALARGGAVRRADRSTA